MKEIIRGCKSSSETENRFIMNSLSRYHSAPSVFFDNFLDPQQQMHEIKEPDRDSEIINLLFSDDFAPPEASVLTRQRVEASHEYGGMLPRLASVNENQILAVLEEETFKSSDSQDFQESGYGHGGYSHSHGSHAPVKSEQIELSQADHVFSDFSISNSGSNGSWMKKEQAYEQFAIEKGISSLELQSRVKVEDKPERLGVLLRQTSSPADFFASCIPESRNTQDSVTRHGIPQFFGDPSSPDSDGMSYTTRKRFRIPELPLPPSLHQQQDQGLWLSSQASSPTDQFNSSSQFRAKRGFATHPRSVAERIRRSRISERIKKLQEVVPNMDKQTNTAEMLEEAVEYVKFLQKQVELLSNRGRATSLY